MSGTMPTRLKRSPLEPAQDAGGRRGTAAWGGAPRYVAPRPELTAERLALLARFDRVRQRTEHLASPLTVEDQLLQAMPEASPTKWHRAHTTWFFERAVLAQAHPFPRPIDPRHEHLWGSHFESYGAVPAQRRGLVSRPSLAEVARYRRSVEERLRELVATADAATFARLVPLVELGLAHEQQHQELILSDILAAFAKQPLRPVYRTPWSMRDLDARPALWPSLDLAPAPVPARPRFRELEGGLVAIGAPRGAIPGASEAESPRHRVWLEPYTIAEQLVTVGEMRAFIAGGGYRTPSLWLARGWDFVCAHGIEAPRYVRVEDGEYRQFTLEGERRPSDDEPVSHLSFYEADALARFLGGRLPTEAEWEHAFAREPSEPDTLDGDGLDFDDTPPLYPLQAPSRTGALGVYGAVWQWTSSAYVPYPGHQPSASGVTSDDDDARFMSDARVLRGSSCFTAPGSARATQRNFWQPTTRFQMTGLRLARDL